MTKHICATGALLLCLIPPLARPALAIDFSELNALAEGALVGVNVDDPIPGFEIKLLRDGQVLYHQAYGAWSLDRPANADSSTKTLSGALMMKLAEVGVGGFSLDSRLRQFLPEYLAPGLRDITVRQAFSHTSGMAGQENSPLILGNANITLRQSASLIAASQQPLPSGPPGTAFEYGGLSMQAAGAAAEVAFGDSYINLFDQFLASPMELVNTQFVIASDANPRVAGGIESTATDFGRVMDMLLNGGVDRVSGERILSQASVDEMLTRQTSDTQTIVVSPTDNNRYGIGVWLDQLDEFGPPVAALAGGLRGFHSWIDLTEGLVFTFATDTTLFSNVDGLSSRMHAAVLAAIVPEPAGGALLAAAAFAAVAGLPKRRLVDNR